MGPLELVFPNILQFKSGNFTLIYAQKSRRLKRSNDLADDGISTGRISRVIFSRPPKMLLDGQVSSRVTRSSLSPSRLRGDKRTQNAEDGFPIKIYNDVTVERTTLLCKEKENALAIDNTAAEKGILH